MKEATRPDSAAGEVSSRPDEAIAVPQLYRGCGTGAVSATEARRAKMVVRSIGFIDED